jgi:hypothetical protein
MSAFRYIYAKIVVKTLLNNGIVSIDKSEVSPQRIAARLFSTSKSSPNITVDVAVGIANISVIKII